MDQSGLIPLFVGALAAILLLAVLKRVLSKQRRSPMAPGVTRYEALPALCSPAELAFLAALDRAIGPAYRVFAKVRLADVITAPGQAQAAMNRIMQKHIDFLVCDRASTRPLLAIELNDASHARKDRRQRDDFLVAAMASANVSLMFWRCAASYDAVELREAIGQHLAGSDGVRPL